MRYFSDRTFNASFKKSYHSQTIVSILQDFLMSLKYLINLLYHINKTPMDVLFIVSNLLFVLPHHYLGFGLFDEFQDDGNND